jgi:hypothetical protein
MLELYKVLAIQTLLDDSDNWILRTGQLRGEAERWYLRIVITDNIDTTWYKTQRR